MYSVATDLAIFSGSAGVAATFIQVQKVWKTKKTQGLSAWTTVLIGLSDIGWIMYAQQHRFIPVVIANCFLLPLICYLLYRLARSDQRVQLYISMIGGGIIFGVVLRTLSMTSAGWLAVGSNTLSFLPQFYRAIHEKRLIGISRPSQMMWSVINTSTIIFSLLLHAYPLTVTGACGLFSSIFLLYMTAKKR